MSESWDNVALKFKSANHIPVERATVTRDEFLEIEKERQAGLDALIELLRILPDGICTSFADIVMDAMHAVQSSTGIPIEDVLRRTKKCPDCRGDGFIAEHYPGCDGNCDNFGCPYQVQCHRCYGSGIVEVYND